MPAPIAPGQVPTGVARRNIRDKIQTRIAPGVAAHQSRERHPAAGPKAMPLQCLVRVLRTSGQVSAVEPDQRRQRETIELDKRAACRPRRHRNTRPRAASFAHPIRFPEFKELFPFSQNRTNRMTKQARLPSLRHLCPTRPARTRSTERCRIALDPNRSAYKGACTLSRSVICITWRGDNARTTLVNRGTRWRGDAQAWCLTQGVT